jgi:hypothetical protein
MQINMTDLYDIKNTNVLTSVSNKKATSMD